MDFRGLLSLRFAPGPVWPGFGDDALAAPYSTVSAASVVKPAKQHETALIGAKG
ncbi:MAG: hypothetical protein QOH05_3585 [Acetobacteraceae bacterium]|nr:hypothetical protein [Acetobacteraceae bacterium]